MKHFTLLLLIITQLALVAQPARNDPYFMETTDTVSVHGPRSITRHVLQDRKGNMWFATWQGIMKFDGEVFTNYTLKHGLIHFHVFSIMEDRAGNLWFGTIRGGLYKYDGKTFKLFTTADGLSNDIVGYIMEDRIGNIWIGTDEGISVLDTGVIGKDYTNGATTPWLARELPTKKGFTRYSTANGLAGDRVNSIMQDKTGKIWIGTRTGVSCYDGRNFSNFMLRLGVPFKNVWSIKEDKDGKILIGGEDGLYCYDPTLTGEKAFKQLASEFIGCVIEDKSGNLWYNAGNGFSGKGMGLYKYDGKMSSRITTKHKEGDSQIFEIMEDKDRNIWFGTMNGVERYDGKAFKTFSE